MVRLLRARHLTAFSAYFSIIFFVTSSGRLMRKAMREPLFVEFVDECLRVVDPQPTDITDEQVSLFDSFATVDKIPYKNREECWTQVFHLRSSEWLFQRLL